MAPSLIEQLQIGAVDGSSPITDLLRRAKLAAVKLGADEFAAYVELEMNGYHGPQSVPPYRKVQGNLRFHNPYYGWRPVFGVEAPEVPVFQPAGELFDLARSGSDFLTVAVPEDFRRLVSGQLGFQCEVQIHVSPTSMGAVLEAVRNMVLEWTLKLEKVGIRGDGLSFTAEETKAAQSMFVTNNYHGPVASVAHGSNTIGHISQTNASATPSEIADAIGSLLSAIHARGESIPIPDQAIEELAATQPELKKGKLPFGKIAKALSMIGQAEDIAFRAPEVMERISKIAALFGWHT